MLQGRARRAARAAWAAGLLAVAAAVCPSCDGHHENLYHGPYVPPQDIAEEPEVGPPPFKDEAIFPCSDCHFEGMPINTERRVLEMAHSEIELKHDEDNRWCLDCHDAENRDMLRLASGKLVPFEESYKLCGQCHGDKYRDWRAGIHGRRTGDWDSGQKYYLLCVNCHDSHAPAFPPLEPEPAPNRPEVTR